MKYFNSCKSIEEVKSLFKKLALENHPDRGGDTATMQEINSEYAFVCVRIAKGSGLSNDEADEHIRLSEEYRKVIEQIINLAGIVIEAVGHWIWVTGDTYPVKRELKAAGLFFAHKKMAWYFRSDDYKTIGGKKSLEEIRGKYGTETIHPPTSKSLK